MTKGSKTKFFPRCFERELKVQSYVPMLKCTYMKWNHNKSIISSILRNQYSVAWTKSLKSHAYNWELTSISSNAKTLCKTFDLKYL